MNILFVCTENLARSPLAERLFHELQGPGGLHQARAAGTAPHAPRRLTTREVAWADLVVAMEGRHRTFIQGYWPEHARKVVVLDVADEFDPKELRATIEPKVRALLQQCNGSYAGSVTLAARPRLTKRVFDLLLSGSGLLASAPLWALIALAIKLADGGPIFYAQDRVGKNGRCFRSLKFRSMVADPGGRFRAVQAGRDDARVTPVGRWLRATAMDELPQLWSIFRGDMSFVGPRPLMPEEIEVNGHGHRVPLETIPGYEARHRVTPGLTGLAQVYADRDIARYRKFRYDLLYIKKQSLGLDLRLMLLSVWITVRAKWEHRGRKF